jgi:hypothetical protein
MQWQALQNRHATAQDLAGEPEDANTSTIDDRCCIQDPPRGVSDAGLAAEEGRHREDDEDDHRARKGDYEDEEAGGCGWHDRVARVVSG